jgi:integrase
MTRDELDALTRLYLQASFEEIEARLALEWSAVGREVHLDDLTEAAERTSGELAHGNLRSGLEAARLLAPDADEDDLRKLARRLLEVREEVLRVEIAAFNGTPLTLPRLLAESSASPLPALPESPGSTGTEAGGGPTILEAAETYGAQRVAEGNWSQKTELQSMTIFRVLADLMANPHTASVTKDDIRRVGLDIVKLPSNMTKRFPGKTPREVLVLLEDDTTTPRLEPRSVNKYRQLLRSLFKWAAENDYIATNPAVILGDVKERTAREDRKGFTDEDLRLYFAALPEEPSSRPFLYWIPRILAYSGMRLGEAAQLRTCDVYELEGIPVFDINDDDGKTLKNEASRRQVPVHPRLIDLGLLRFVEESPEGFLWPAEVRTTSNPTRGDMDRLSKLLANVLRKAGVTDPRKTGAHSFRHTVASRLKRASVPEYQIADLIGHEDDSESTGRYGKATPPARLAEVIRLLILPV